VLTQPDVVQNTLDFETRYTIYCNQITIGIWRTKKVGHWSRSRVK